MSTVCEWELDAARPMTTEKPSEKSDLVSKFVSGDRQETDVKNKIAQPLLFTP